MIDALVAAGTARFRGRVQPSVPDPSALPAARPAGRRLAADQRLVAACGRGRRPEPARKPRADRRRRGAAPLHDRADRAAPARSGRRRRQLPRPWRPRAAAARRRDARRDRDDVHLGRTQHDDERDRQRRPSARAGRTASGEASLAARARARASSRRSSGSTRRSRRCGGSRRATPSSADARIEAGDYVWLVFGSATLDAGPAELDPERSPNRHVGFGRGIHQCIGAPLARLEVRIALEELLARTSSFSLAGPVARPAWPRLGVDRLPLAFTPGGDRVNAARSTFELSDGLTLSYLRLGEPGNPELLLLHGGGLSADDWCEVAPALAAAGYHVTVPDLRGCGESDWDPEVRYGVEDTLADLDELDRRPRARTVLPRRPLARRDHGLRLCGTASGARDRLRDGGRRPGRPHAALVAREPDDRLRLRRARARGPRQVAASRSARLGARLAVPPARRRPADLAQRHRRPRALVGRAAASR